MDPVSGITTACNAGVGGVENKQRTPLSVGEKLPHYMLFSPGVGGKNCIVTVLNGLL